MMSPIKITKINGRKVEEYQFSATKTAVLVDNYEVTTDFKTTCQMIRDNKEPKWKRL